MFVILAVQQVIKLVLGGTAQNFSELKTFSGNYLLGEGRKNGKYYWKHQIRDHALWWNLKSNNWAVGDSSHIESPIAKIIGPANDDNLPHLITGWKYWNSAKEKEITLEDYWKFKDDGNLLPI